MIDSPKAKKSKERELFFLGLALVGTVDSLTTTGIPFNHVLSQWGVKKIKDNDKYSADVRIALHEEAYRAYGDEALLAFGYANSLKFQAVDSRWTVKDPRDGSIAELRRVMEGIHNSMQQSALMAVRNLDKKKIGDLKYKNMGNFEYGYTTATRLRHVAFSRGMLEYFMAPLRKYWSIDVSFLKRKSKEGRQWAQIFWSIKFKKHRQSISIGEIRAINRRDVEQKFFKKVLNETQSKNKRIEQLSEQLGKYLPPQILKTMMKSNYKTDIRTHRKKLTIFFSDIKNFTQSSEGLQPEDLTKYLNEYFSEMTQIALDNGATIDKYIGDAMMVFFGDLESKGEKEDARACIKMALEMQERMIFLQDKWRQEGFANPFEVRMGINTGYCNVGNFGSEQRLTYTIIGGEVNVAQRLEAAANAGGALISYESYAHAKDMIEVQPRPSIQMKGINREIKIFSLIGRRTNKTKRENESKLLSTQENKTEPITSSGLDERIRTIENGLLMLHNKITKLELSLIKTEETGSE